MMALDLEAIKARAETGYVTGGVDADGAAFAASNWSSAVADVRSLVFEVERLEAERANADDLLEAVRRNLVTAGEVVEQIRDENKRLHAAVKMWKAREGSDL